MVLAEMAGVSVIELVRIEACTHTPSLYTALAICDALGVELQDVFYIEIVNA